MKRLIGLGLICAAAACGGGGSDGGDDRVEAFIGSWAAASGTSALDCDNDEFDSSETLTGTTQLMAGTDSDLVEVNADATADCPAVKFNVSGSKASITGTKTCNDSGDGITVMGTFNNYDLTLDTAGTTLTISGSLALTISGSVTATCTATVNGTATKAAAREAVTGWSRPQDLIPLAF